MELVLRDISVSFGGKIILNSINLEIGAGELVALLGPSGCGKSTLLKTIAGLFTPQSGDVFIHGQNVSNQPASMRGAVIVFQDLRLFPNMTVEENIAFPLKIRGVSKVDRHRQAQKLIAGIRLEGLGERKISEMSGGQLQRVALARALAAEPKILLLDEPFSSLDENLRQEMRRLVLDLRREYEMTILLVTHDQQEAFLMADRIAVMLDGKIIQYDTPRNIYQGPANKTVADYLGGGNYIQGDVRNGRFHSAIVNFSVQKPDGRYLALFRPSAVTPVIMPPDASLSSHPCCAYEITDLHYLGEKTEIIVQGCGHRFVITENSGLGLSIGDRINIRFDPAKAILIKNME